MPQKSEGLVDTATGSSVKVMLMMQVNVSENRNFRKSGMRGAENKWRGSSVVPSRVQGRAFVLLCLGCLSYGYINVCGMNILAFYEGWNFNSGNYLFTTDTK